MPYAPRSGARGLAQGRRTPVGLDDHTTGTPAEQVGRGRADALLARGSMDRRPVDHIRAHSFDLLDQRRPRIACTNQAGVDLKPRAPGLDARALQHRAALRLLL